jgi:hypothetical protein
MGLGSRSREYWIYGSHEDDQQLRRERDFWDHLHHLGRKYEELVRGDQDAFNDPGLQDAFERVCQQSDRVNVFLEDEPTIANEIAYGDETYAAWVRFAEDLRRQLDSIDWLSRVSGEKKAFHGKLL